MNLELKEQLINQVQKDANIGWLKVCDTYIFQKITGHEIEIKDEYDLRVIFNRSDVVFYMRTSVNELLIEMYTEHWDTFLIRNPQLYLEENYNKLVSVLQS